MKFFDYYDDFWTFFARKDLQTESFILYQTLLYIHRVQNYKNPLLLREKYLRYKSKLSFLQYSSAKKDLINRNMVKIVSCTSKGSIGFLLTEHRRWR